MKNLKSRIWFKRFVTTIALSSTIFVTGFSSYIEKQNSKINKYEAVTPFNIPAFEDFSPAPLPHLPKGSTPKTLLTLPTLNILDGNAQNSAQMQGIVTTLKNNSWLTNKVMAKYKEAMTPILINTLLPGMFPDINKKADQGKLLFNSEFYVNKIVEEINQIKPSSLKDVLKITKPEHIYEYFTPSTPGTIAGSSIPVSSDFAYKVAEIDLATLENNKNVIFKIKNLADTNAANHDYSLVIYNKEGGLKKDLLGSKGKTATKSIADMISERRIFIRDEHQKQIFNFSGTATKTAPNLDFIKFSLTNGKINIFVKPVSTDSAKPIEFKLSTASNAIKKGIKIGILDNTYSPLHLKSIVSSTITQLSPTWHSNPVDPKKVMLSNGVSAKVFKLSSTWKVEKSLTYKKNVYKKANHIRFFMAKGAGKISLSLKFDGKDADAFKDSNNIFSIDFDAVGQITKPKSQLQINPIQWTGSKGVAAAGTNVLPIGVSLNALPSKLNPELLQVDIFLQAGVISVMSDLVETDKEQPFVLKSTSSRIFFEPFTKTGYTPVDGKTKGVDIINVEKAAKMGNLNKLLVGKVFANWSNPIAQKSSDKEFLMKPQPTWFKKGINPNELISFNNTPQFNINHDIWFEKSNGQFSKVGVKNALLSKNKLSDNEKSKFLIVQNPKTGEPSKKSNGIYATIPAIGSNIIKQLELVSVLYDKWIKQLDSSNKDIRDSYIISDVSTSSGATQKLIISKSGKSGEITNDIVAATLARYFEGKGNFTADQEAWKNAFERWEASSYDQLKDDEKKLIAPIVDTYGKVPPWMGKFKLSDIKDVGKTLPGKSLNTTLPAYRNGIQYMLWIIAPYFAEAINQIFKNEQDKFNAVKGQILGKYMEKVLNFKSKYNDIAAINSKSIQIIKEDKLPTVLKGIKLLQLIGSPIDKVNSIKLALESMIKFIYDTKLEEKYLTNLEAIDFKAFYKDKSLTSTSTYKDKSKKKQMYSSILILDKIIGKIINAKKNKDSYTFTEIINKIVAGDFKSKKPEDEIAKEISKTISKAINIITLPSKVFKYEYFGGTASSSYIENLIIGNNIKETVTKWRDDAIRDKRKYNKDVIEDIILNDSAFEPKQITQLAINTGAYNIRFFINSLTLKDKVVSAALDLYNSDLEHSLLFELPEGNWLVKTIASPASMSQVSLGFIGAIIFIIGILTMIVSFKTKIKTAKNKATLLLLRGSFSLMIIGGLTIVLIGVLIVI